MSYPKMASADRIELFKNQLAMIENGNIKELVVQCLEKAPNYFFYMPASTSGKHHNENSAGEGGLVRHTKMLCTVAQELFRLEMFNKKVLLDHAIASCILHDTCKCGRNDNGVKYEFLHPEIAAKFVCEVGDSLGINSLDLKLICDAIYSHMGQWNIGFDKVSRLPKPSNTQQYFVHLCDYLASRRTVTVAVE